MASLTPEVIASLWILISLRTLVVPLMWCIARPAASLWNIHSTSPLRVISWSVTLTRTVSGMSTERSSDRPLPCDVVVGLGGEETADGDLLRHRFDSAHPERGPGGRQFLRVAVDVPGQGDRPGVDGHTDVGAVQVQQPFQFLLDRMLELLVGKGQHGRRRGHDLMFTQVGRRSQGRRSRSGGDPRRSAGTLSGHRIEVDVGDRGPPREQSDGSGR